ncbi:hypothetical protein HK102_002428 [Quaeritorhiza haematococci]|nr:hypothetical protein HK102_002428 [Quaeritorhiza haematococci]
MEQLVRPRPAGKKRNMYLSSLDTSELSFFHYLPHSPIPYNPYTLWNESPFLLALRPQANTFATPPPAEPPTIVNFPQKWDLDVGNGEEGSKEFDPIPVIEREPPSSKTIVNTPEKLDLDVRNDEEGCKELVPIPVIDGPPPSPTTTVNSPNKSDLDVENGEEGCKELIPISVIDGEPPSSKTTVNSPQISESDVENGEDGLDPIPVIDGDRTVFVGNLPPRFAAEDLRDLFADVAEQIAEAHFAGRTFGFVTFVTHAAAETALKTNGMLGPHGKPFSIQFAKSQPKPFPDRKANDTQSSPSSVPPPQPAPSAPVPTPPISAKISTGRSVQQHPQQRQNRTMPAPVPRLPVFTGRRYLQQQQQQRQNRTMPAPIRVSAPPAPAPAPVPAPNPPTFTGRRYLQQHKLQPRRI